MRELSSHLYNQNKFNNIVSEAIKSLDLPDSDSNKNQEEKDDNTDSNKFSEENKEHEKQATTEESDEENFDTDINELLNNAEFSEKNRNEGENDNNSTMEKMPNFSRKNHQILNKNLYKKFTEKFDEVAKAENLETKDEISRLRKNLDQQLTSFQNVIAKLANKLQRQLLAKQNRSWEFDLEEGMLDSSKLTRIVIDPFHSLSFKREKNIDFKDTVVTLLIDNSGSMRGRPITIAALCADILSRTL